MTEKNQNDQV